MKIKEFLREIDSVRSELNDEDYILICVNHCEKHLEVEGINLDENPIIIFATEWKE